MIILLFLFVSTLISGTEIPQTALKVLSVIAYEQPVTKTRLNEILGKSVKQELDYLYDNAGNILNIYDNVNNLNESMTYDSLNRLTEAEIGADLYKYSYNALGNMMKIVHNNETKILYYNSY